MFVLQYFMVSKFQATENIPRSNQFRTLDFEKKKANFDKISTKSGLSPLFIPYRLEQISRGGEKVIPLSKLK